MLMRKETIQLAELIREVEQAATQKSSKTIRNILVGERMNGKSTLVLQGLTMAFLRKWTIVNLPDGMICHWKNYTYINQLTLLSPRYR